MKLALEDYKKFIELVCDIKVIEIKKVEKDIISYTVADNKRKFLTKNLHSLSVDALNLLSKKYKLNVQIVNGKCKFSIDKFKMETPIKDWTNTIIFIAILKLSK